MKKIKDQLKKMSMSPFTNNDALISFTMRLKSVVYEMTSEILDWRDQNEKTHRAQDKLISDMDKAIKRLERRVKNLELKPTVRVKK